jgi:hypothetical protein
LPTRQRAAERFHRAFARADPASAPRLPEVAAYRSGLTVNKSASPQQGARARLTGWAGRCEGRRFPSGNISDFWPDYASSTNWKGSRAFTMSELTLCPAREIEAFWIQSDPVFGPGPRPKPLKRNNCSATLGDPENFRKSYDSESQFHDHSHGVLPVWSKNSISMKSKDDCGRGRGGPNGEVTPRYTRERSPRNVGMVPSKPA